jgi:hypothetical protein
VCYNGHGGIWRSLVERSSVLPVGVDVEVGADARKDLVHSGDALLRYPVSDPGHLRLQEAETLGFRVSMSGTLPWAERCGTCFTGVQPFKEASRLQSVCLPPGHNAGRCLNPGECTRNIRERCLREL